MEEWKDIIDYEGMYQVSSEGRVKSLKYGKERILKPASETGGYLQITLLKNGKSKHYRIHRLVANAFIPNIENKPEINHIDEDKTNNNVMNLEWSTREENCNYGTHNTRISKTLTNRTDQSIPIDMLTKNGELIRTFPSGKEAMRWLRANGFPKAKNGAISSCCKGNPKYTHAYGFKWQYTKKELPN